MKLYDYILSPSCYKIRLMASLLGVPLTLRPVDFHPGEEHLTPEFLALNPAGTLPILADGGLLLTETSAMLVHLATSAGPDWLARHDPQAAASEQQWLSFAHRLTASLGGARLCDMFQRPGDLASLQRQGIMALRELEVRLFEQRLRQQAFLASDRPTIADIACFPHVVLAPDGGISLDPYPSIRLWQRSIRGLPGFIEMPGIYRRHELSEEPDPDAANETAEQV
ncbi:glutathione S-transferase family protein [Rhizobium sp. SL86]|uniref:glutathione S-transferase family protein n=1 Tax=Rhizobium sp. SL86 TaxID=2995148 RepID=UPI00227402A9|nr:glutathione S-transferase family protein [Rhizobium sp. SL86]MCY1666388.1 glutathione S-transferase family protein [Rhizobium sp. SL86]